MLEQLKYLEFCCSERGQLLKTTIDETPSYDRFVLNFPITIRHWWSLRIGGTHDGSLITLYI